ncbi:MAG TPA: hypothetical protein VNR90_10985, partial [Vicinamibacterales bacterium]|nr:hypothetical protein [Vicinamibacterales bacterium]
GFRASGVVATCLPASGCDHTDIDQSTTLSVLGSLIDGNHSAGKGAGISSEGVGATVLITHSAIVNNAADNDGGGVYMGGGWSNDAIRSSTISGNTSNGVGGGILVRFAEMTNTYLNIENSTIANNVAAGSGGGVEFEPARVGRQDIAVFASIIAGNASLSADVEWNINSSWAPPTDPPGVFNCIDGFIYVAPGRPRPTDMGGCTFDVRNPFLGPLTPMGGAGDLPVQLPLLGSPAVDGAPDDTARDQQRDDWIYGTDLAMPAAWTLFDRVVDGDGDGMAARDMGAIERNDRWQTELLAVRAQGASTHTVVTIPDGYERGAGTTYAATSDTNEFVTYALPIGEPGRYDVTTGARRDGDGGKFQIAIATDPAGPWTPLGPEQDGYSASGTFVSLGPFTTPLFPKAGEALVRFLVTGKNPASNGYHVNLDFIETKKRTGACPVADLAAGQTHTCALLSSGGVRCWGGDANGQLGDGGGADTSRPPAIDAIGNAQALATGASHTCVLSTAGDVRCWGANASGQLGDGTTTARATPPSAPVLSGVKAIAAGRDYTCALMNGGGVRCWGGNASGQLGDGGTSNRLAPPSSDVLSNVKAITAGGAHTCALTTTGGVRCWGANASGQLGDGTTDDRPAPPSSDAVGGIAAVSAGDTHTCAITNAGGLRCWGHNGDGEIGIGNYDLVLSPPNSDVLSG